MKRFILFISIIKSFFLNYYFGFKKVLFIGNGIIFINKKTTIGNGTNIYGRYRIEVINEDAILSIGNNCSIAENLHLTCGKNIIIGNNVSIANNVTITDINHTYSNLNLAIGKNSLKMLSVKIGSGSFIGCNVYIAPGVEIGNHCFIGANSTVFNNFSDFSIIVGSPAKKIKSC